MTPQDYERNPPISHTMKGILLGFMALAFIVFETLGYRGFVHSKFLLAPDTNSGQVLLILMVEIILIFSTLALFKPVKLKLDSFSYERALPEGKNLKLSFIYEWPQPDEKKRSDLPTKFDATFRSALAQYLDTTKEPITYDGIKNTVFAAVFRELQEHDIEVFRIKITDLTVSSAAKPLPHSGIIIGSS